MIKQYLRVIRYKNGCIKLKNTSNGVDVLVVKDNRIVEAVVNQLDLHNDSIIDTMIQSYKIKHNIQLKQSDVTYIKFDKCNFTISGDESLIDILVSCDGSNIIRDYCFWGNYFCLNHILSLTALFLPKQN